MKQLLRFRNLAAIFVAAIVGAACSDASAAAPEMTVYATPTCGCCGNWVDHMRENGFTVNVVYQDDLSDVRIEHKLPRDMVSCHMGVVNGFAVEGHVPAHTVRKLLAERPAVLGIAAPGMPVGAPGMEHPDGLTQPYEVYSWDEAGSKALFEAFP